MALQVGYATATPEAAAEAVAARYDVGEVTGCTLLSRGFNDIYAITTHGARRILRISGNRARGMSDVQEETAFIAHLAAAGVPVAAALPTRAGALSTMLDMPEGPRPAALFHDAGGRLPELDSKDDAAAQGATLAVLHTAAETYAGANRFPLDAARLIHRPLRAVLDLGIQEPAATSDLTGLAARFDARLADASPALARTRCHGDCHGLNARIQPDGAAVFFDFDDGGRGFLAYDLAVHLWAQVSFGRRRQAVWHAFLAGYRARRPLAPPDLDAIELFVPLRHLWLMGEFASQTAKWGTDFFSPAWLRRETAFLLDWERERLDPPLLYRPGGANRVTDPYAIPARSASANGTPAAMLSRQRMGPA